VIDSSALFILILGLVVTCSVVAPVYLLTRSRTAHAQADAENRRRYQELAEQNAASQQQIATELARLTERVAAIEKLLRDVG
jgi:hypothetical protein